MLTPAEFPQLRNDNADGKTSCKHQQRSAKEQLKRIAVKTTLYQQVKLTLLFRRYHIRIDPALSSTGDSPISGLRELRAS
jgi:hypothetical protein